MIKKLRIKFICINLSFVSLVLVCVAASFYFSYFQRMKWESIQAMERALSEQNGSPHLQKPNAGQKPFREDLNIIPVFIALIREDGSIISSGQTNVTVTAEVLMTAAAQARQQGGNAGTLRGLKLRYRVQDTPDGLKIAFADISHEISSMHNQLLNGIIVIICGLAAFFLISLFLSRWALKPVEQAWRRQRQFVADASHELKTPLTVILANTDILSSHPEDRIAQQMKWVDNSRAEAGRMKKLIENLLFLARFDAEQVPVIKSTFDVSDALWNCLLPFESVAFERSITISEQIESNVSMYGNKDQFKQLAAILLDNACKYAGKSGTVSVKLKKEQGKITLLVNNNGSLIPEEDLEHIFERFFRSDKSRTRQEGGYGLGLAIASSIAESHHGRISAASDAETGTTFRVIFPV